MTKITADHLARGAFVYIRQSTSYQLRTIRRAEGWSSGRVSSARPMFALSTMISVDLAAESFGRVSRSCSPQFAGVEFGAVLSIEASRLARNGRDWHTLLEFCGLVETVIIDEDGIYDPRMPNDRLLLGMKGAMSETETSVFRQRSMEAIRQKALCGELFLTVAVGHEKTEDDRIEKSPDRGVRDAVRLVFSKFAELQTVCQVLVWMRQEQILLPAIVSGAGTRALEWKLPVYHMLHHTLTNPVYAGAYAFGRGGLVSPLRRAANV